MIKQKHKIKKFFTRIYSFVKKQSHIAFILVLIPLSFWISFWLVPNHSDHTIEIKEEEFPYQQVILPYFDGNNFTIQSFISGALGTTFNLEWYDVCLENHMYVTKNGSKIDGKSIFGERTGNLIVSIYPLLFNQLLHDEFDFLKEKNEGFTDYENMDVAYSKDLEVLPWETNCILLKNDERGFIFDKVKIMIGDIGLQTAKAGESIDSNMSIIPSDGNIYGNAGDFRLFIRGNKIAILLKRFSVILLIYPVMLIICQIWRFVFKQTSPR